ncbi:hypothetical protein M422DRAFT_270922, partial [Sphaerobolus stellatus SS14]
AYQGDDQAEHSRTGNIIVPKEENSEVKALREVQQLDEPSSKGPEVTGREDHQHESGSVNDTIVKCHHIDQKRSTIKEVIESKMCPNKFRIRCRIFDYYPLQVESFVRAECKEHGVLDGNHDGCPHCGDMTNASIAVDYKFVLRVVDESNATLNVSVDGKEAAQFIPDLSPADARNNEQALKQRLETLIGHLYAWHNEFEEAKKKEGPQIDLCVYSWMPASGVDRHYKLFDCNLI